MKLNKEEEKILEGKEGKAKQKAMEILVALGKIYNADKLIPVSSVQVSGISYKNLGDAGLEFLEEWSKEGAFVKTNTILNPAGIDLDKWQELGFSNIFAINQLKVIECFKKFGIPPICTCTPYLIGNIPNLGEHIAWAESSAVSFANSVLGARTNREGGPSALASAIIGKTPNFGFHLEENRKADYIIKVNVSLKNEADYGALGYIAGKKVKNKVPYFIGNFTNNIDYLKILGASMAASGSVALYHIENITPEAKIYKKNIIKKDAQIIEISYKDIIQAYNELNTYQNSPENLDMIALGCPHASIFEIQKIAQIIKNKKLKPILWITTSIAVYEMAKRAGYLKIIEKAGGKIVSDTCMVVSPIKELGINSIGTNSAKAACYLPSHCKVKVKFDSAENLLLRSNGK